MLADSQLLHDLHLFAYNPAGQPVCVYGDPAYPLRVQMQGPFRYGVLTPQMEQYNTQMSAVRSSVEWLFGDVINSFKFNDFKKYCEAFETRLLLVTTVTDLIGPDDGSWFGKLSQALFHWFE